MYCLKCKTHTDTESIKFVKSKNGKNMKQGICKKCGKRKSQFVKAQDVSGGGSKKKLQI